MPFISFLTGYCATLYLFSNSTIATPHLIGTQVENALTILAQNNLNLRIIGYNTDNELPNGTIINQNPKPDEKIKQQQTIYCIVSQISIDNKAPDCTNLMLPQIKELLDSMRYRYKIDQLIHTAPQNYCIAQLPRAQEKITETVLTLYVSAGTPQLVIVPSFKGKMVDEVIDFLKKHTINRYILHTHQTETNHTCNSCIVTNQRPLPGSIIDLEKQPHIQLQVHNL